MKNQSNMYYDVEIKYKYNGLMGWVTAKEEKTVFDIVKLSEWIVSILEYEFTNIDNDGMDIKEIVVVELSVKTPRNAWHIVPLENYQFLSCEYWELYDKKWHKIDGSNWTIGEIRSSLLSGKTKTRQIA